MPEKTYTNGVMEATVISIKEDLSTIREEMRRDRETVHETQVKIFEKLDVLPCANHAVEIAEIRTTGATLGWIVKWLFPAPIVFAIILAVASLVTGQ